MTSAIGVAMQTGTASACGVCVMPYEQGRKKEPSRIRPPEPIAGVLRFIGRHTLEIYAIQLAGSELLVKLLPDLAP
jgi:hypothetical protein